MAQVQTKLTEQNLQKLVNEFFLQGFSEGDEDNNKAENIESKSTECQLSTPEIEKKLIESYELGYTVRTALSGLRKF